MEVIRDIKFTLIMNYNEIKALSELIGEMALSEMKKFISEKDANIICDEIYKGVREALEFKD